MKKTSCFNKLLIGGLVVSGLTGLGSYGLAQSQGENPEAQSQGSGGPGGPGGRGPFQDTDGDGSISQAEFLAPLQERLASQDQDGNGCISQEEVVAHAGERFNEIDQSGDGVLSQEELQQHRRSRRGNPPSR